MRMLPHAKSLRAGDFAACSARRTAFMPSWNSQGRGALHYHLLFWGSYAPHVLAQVAAMPELKSKLEQALKTQTVVEIPRDMHVARLRARGLRAKRLDNDVVVLPAGARCDERTRGAHL